MAHHVFRKGGIPALASSLDAVTSFSCRCSLSVKVDVPGKRATLSLHLKVPLHGFETDQNIVLVYDADNLMPGETTVSCVNLSPPQVQQIARHEGSNLRLLRFVLEEPCTVLYPRSSDGISPKNASDTQFQQLVNLAKATKLYIVFDYAWVHPNKSAQFLTLIETTGFIGFARENNRVHEADWTIFAPGETAYDDTPPSYEDASLKRARQSRSSSPEVVAVKRRLLESALKIEPPSPTEKATTTTASPSPRLLPSSPVGGPFDIQDAVETAVAKLLPDAVRAVLSDMLLRQLPSSISSSSPQRPSPPPNPTFPLHKLILSHITAHADELAHQLSVDLHDVAAVELQEQLDDHRLKMTVLKEDGLMEINRFCDAKLQELDDHSAHLVESVETETTDAFHVAKDTFDQFVGERRKALAEKMLEFERSSSKSQSQSQRARSLPLNFV